MVSWREVESVKYGRNFGDGMPGKTILLALLIFTSAITTATAGGSIPFTMAIYNPYSQDGGHTWTFEELAAHGFGAFYQQADWTWEWFSPGWHEERMGTDSVEAARHGLYYVAGGYYHSPPWDMINFTYNRAVNWDGVVEVKTPSPVDENYWKYIMEEGAVNLANLSLHYPIWGLVWDIELYNHGAFGPSDYSYDEGALMGFAEDINRSIPQLAPNQRYSWLRDNGLLGAFQDWCADRAFELARGTLEKVQSINPEFRLGILYFEERSWFHWALVRGLGSHESPTSAWTEKTYAGYKHGPGGGDKTYLEMWEEHGVHGQFIPGIAAIEAWKQFGAMEQALRYMGHLWLYQRHYPYERGAEFDRTFSFVQKYVLFNGTGINPLPTFRLHPGLNASPHMGPDGKVSCFLDTHVWSLPPPTSYRIITDADEIEYSGSFNYTTRILRGPDYVLHPDDFPCIIHGLSEDDLERTEITAVIQEVEDIAGFYHRLGLGNLSEIVKQAGDARGYMEQGRLGESRVRSLEARSGAYAALEAAVWPMVDEANANPRESEIPLSLLSVFANARNMMSGQDLAKGQSYLYTAVRDWSSSVPEVIPSMVSIITGLGILSLRKT